jgi:hypothetical protein
MTVCCKWSLHLCAKNIKISDHKKDHWPTYKAVRRYTGICIPYTLLLLNQTTDGWR